MKIRHPSDDRTRTIDADRFEMYESQGWVEVQSAPPAKKAAASDDKGK